MEMETVGLRELRQNASEYVRRAEAGERLLVSVSGRPVAALVPATGRAWRRWDEVAELFAGPADPDWETDREVVDQSIRDPWDDA
jgi:prevent-host-death family protein